MTRHSLIGFAFVCLVSLLVVPTQAQGKCDPPHENDPSTYQAYEDCLAQEEADRASAEAVYQAALDYEAQAEDDPVEDEPPECEVRCWDEIADGVTRCSLWLATCTVLSSVIPAVGQVVGIPSCLATSLMCVSFETLYTYTTVCSEC